MKISYRQRIFWLMSFTLLLLIILTIVLAEIGMRNFFKKDLIAHAELMANTFVESSLPFFLYYDWEELQRLARNLSYPELLGFQIIDRENILRISTKDEALIGKKHELAFLPTKSEITISKPYILFDGNKKIPCVDVYVPVKVENSSEPWGTIILTLSKKKMDQGLSRMRFALISIGLFLIIAMSILNRSIASYIEKPLKVLSDHVKEISIGNYEKRIEPLSMGEFEVLVKSINSMAESLAKREKELKDAKDFLEERVRERTEELRKSEEKYKDFFERAGEAIMIIDILRMEVEKANEMAEKLLGYPEKIESKPISMLDTENESLKELINSTMEKSASYSPRLELKRSDGSTIPVEIKTKFIGGNLIQAIFRDITEKEKIENLMIETERWKAMAELSEGFAHNFNNLLTVISGRAQLIKEASDKKKILKNIEVIEKMVGEGINITSKLIEFSQLKMGKKELKPININDLILGVIELTKPKWKDTAEFDGKLIEIKKHLGDVPEIIGNRAELEGALLNIIYNSVEAIEGEGTIEFSTYFENPYIQIVIKDTGCSISPENIKRIFDPFFTTKGTIGTGLGLTISYNIVKRHGGDIKVESEKGKGTKITILLPATNS